MRAGLGPYFHFGWSRMYPNAVNVRPLKFRRDGNYVYARIVRAWISVGPLPAELAMTERDW
jgi:hypothetical protein